SLQLPAEDSVSLVHSSAHLPSGFPIPCSGSSGWRYARGGNSTLTLSPSTGPRERERDWLFPSLPSESQSLCLRRCPAREPLIPDALAPGKGRRSLVAWNQDVRPSQPQWREIEIQPLPKPGLSEPLQSTRRQRLRLLGR